MDSSDGRHEPATAELPRGGETGARPPAGTTVTMRDIAAAAGVSMSTVSRVINNAPSRVTIADETRDRIEQAAFRLGYRPNPFARALRGAPTMLIGAVVRDFSDPFFAGALEVLASEAQTRGYSIVLGHVQGSEDEGRAVQTVLEPGLCDVIVVVGEMEDQPRLLAHLAEARQPVVAVWQGSSPVRFPTVDVDDRSGVMTGLQHLVQLGHRRIGFVSARLPGDNPTREQAYIDFMTEHVGGVSDGYVQRCESSLAGGERALAAMLRLADVPSAIACSTDVTAVGVLHGAHSHGVTVPDGLSVVGYDDLPFAAYTIPALTTMRMPTTEILMEAVRSAIELARNPSAPRTASRTFYAPSLIARASTAPPQA